LQERIERVVGNIPFPFVGIVGGGSQPQKSGIFSHARASQGRLGAEGFGGFLLNGTNCLIGTVFLVQVQPFH
jgi:hypothetical protein